MTDKDMPDPQQEEDEQVKEIRLRQWARHRAGDGAQGQ